MITNVFGYAGFIAVAAIAGLVAQEMRGGDATLAGIPPAAATIGTAVAATPLALRSRRRGRRRGVLVGYLFGIVGAILGFLAAQGGLFWPFVAASFVFGVGNASNLQNRYAAADLADEKSRAREISMVVWVGTLGGVLGPMMARWANRVGMDAGIAEWVTPLLLGALGFTIAAVLINFLLRPDPLEFAGGVDPDAPRAKPVSGILESFRVIWPVTHARLALGAMAVSQMAMVAVMVMTPLHMDDHGHGEMSLFVISLHVFGMFGLAPFIGRFADKYGRIRSLMVGAVILGSGTVAAVIAGYVPQLVFIGLFLLGVGWNFAFIAGSALLTESLPEAERVGAQGLSDVLMSVLAALAAIFSGMVKSGVGYHWLANFATMSAVLILVSAYYVYRLDVAPVRAAT